MYLSHKTLCLKLNRSRQKLADGVDFLMRILDLTAAIKYFKIALHRRIQYYI